jgi:5-methyltetrahydropteroyltriglutamate--homocysteine methyltransferase
MAAREQYSRGKLPKGELTLVEDEGIREAVAMQERVGIGAITDGEYRKRGWREFLYDKCDGFGPDTVERAFPIRLYDGTTAPPIREPKVTAKLKRREPLSAGDFSALKTMTRGPIKANLPTPSVAHFFTGDAVLDRTAYGNREELMDDLARIMREEIADLAARGCTYLQMDEVPLAVICDPKNMEVVRARDSSAVRNQGHSTWRAQRRRDRAGRYWIRNGARQRFDRRPTRRYLCKSPRHRRVGVALPASGGLCVPQFPRGGGLGLIRN